MRSKNLSCKLSWPLIRKDLTRFWPVWASYLVIWLLILPTPLVTGNYRDISSHTDLIRSVHRQIVSAGGEEAAIVMTAIYGCLAAFAVWSYLYQSRSASLFHALPVTRETLFCSHFTAGLSFLLLPNVAIAALTYVCQAGLGYFDPTQILCWLAVVCLESLLFYSLGTLAAMCTGSLPAMPVLYGLINFAVVVCESLMMEFSSQLYWGVSSQPLKLTFLSPAIHLAQSSVHVNEGYLTTTDGIHYYEEIIRYYNPEHLTLLCVYALAAVALIAGSLLLYRRRATESAGDVIAFDFLKPVAKYCFAFGCALVLGWLLDEVLFPSGTTVVTRIFCCCVGGAVGYITAAMLLKKSFRVFQPRKLAGLLALWVALSGLFAAFNADVFGVESYVPRAGEVIRVELHSDYVLELTQPQDIDPVLALHRDILAHKDALRVDLNRDRPYVGATMGVGFTYTLEDGSTLRRNYTIPYDAALVNDPSTPLGKLAAIMDQPQRLVDYYLPPKDAIIESIQIHLHDDTLNLKTGAAFSGRYGSAYVNDDHFDQLLAALEDDIRAGRLCGWHRRKSYDKDYSNLLSIEFNYDVPAAQNTHTYLSYGDVKVAASEGSQWTSIAVYSYNNPVSTLNLLVELGYLTGIPSVFEGEVVYE